MRNINIRNFRRYGWLITVNKKKHEGKKKSFFHIVLTEPRRCGWRIAYLVLRDESARYLERHPDSFESFEPLSGKTLIYVAEKKDHNKIKCFCLNHPVILKKGIWHNLITLTGQSELKISENAKVKCDYWQLGCTLENKKGW